MAVQSGTYSFLNVNSALQGPGGNVTLSTAGIGEGGIRIAMSRDKNRMNIGANGDGMHSLIADNSGTITISLLKTATGNAILNKIYRFQKRSAALWGRNIIRIVNPVTGDSITATSCSFIKQPDLAYTSEGNMNEWAFASISIDEVLGDSNTSGG